jgi:hypothetical protein
VRHDLLVEIDEIPLELRRQQPPNRALATAHEADQKNFIHRNACNEKRTATKKSPTDRLRPTDVLIRWFQPGQAGTKLHHKGTKFTKKNLCVLCAFVVQKFFAFFARFLLVRELHWRSSILLELFRF